MSGSIARTAPACTGVRVRLPPQCHDERMTKGRRLWLVLLLNVTMVLALAIVGLVSHSLGVLAAGGDYLGDAAGVALALVALRASRHGTERPRSYPALANATFLLAVTIGVVVEAVHRLAGGAPRIESLPVVVVVSLVAGLVMAACALIVGTVEEGDFNMRSVMLDTLADGASAAGVAASGAIVLVVGGVYWLDAAVALAIAAIVAYHALKLIGDVAQSSHAA